MADPREQQHGCGPCRRGKLKQARQETALCTWKPSRVRDVKGAQRSAFSRPSGSGARSSPARRATPECAPYGSSLTSPNPLATAKTPVPVPPAERGPGRLTLQLDRDPLHDVACHPALATVVEPGCARIGVAGQVLHVFQGDALSQEISDRRDAKGMR